jgi:hypothetical protein
MVELMAELLFSELINGKRVIKIRPIIVTKIIIIWNLPKGSFEMITKIKLCHNTSFLFIFLKILKLLNAKIKYKSKESHS